MIDKDKFRKLLVKIGFTKKGEVYEKKISDIAAILKVDFKKQELIYPEDKGMIVNERQTCNFSVNENFVVFECVHRLLSKGYRPEHIELEPKWKVGRGASGGRADILVKDNLGNATVMQNIKVPVPSLDEQRLFVSKVESLEKLIANAQAVIDAAPARKEAVMKKYL